MRRISVGSHHPETSAIDEAWDLVEQRPHVRTEAAVPAGRTPVVDAAHIVDGMQGSPRGCSLPPAGGVAAAVPPAASGVAAAAALAEPATHRHFLRLSDSAHAHFDRDRGLLDRLGPGLSHAASSVIGGLAAGLGALAGVRHRRASVVLGSVTFGPCVVLTGAVIAGLLRHQDRARLREQPGHAARRDALVAMRDAYRALEDPSVAEQRTLVHLERAARRGSGDITPGPDDLRLMGTVVGSCLLAVLMGQGGRPGPLASRPGWRDCMGRLGGPAAMAYKLIELHRAVADLQAAAPSRVALQPEWDAALQPPARRAPTHSGPRTL